MNVRDVSVRRLSIVSSRPFDEVVARLSLGIGRPDMILFRKALTEAQTPGQLEAAVSAAIGPSELMEFGRFDAGEVLRKAGDTQAPRVLRLLVGNPLIMKEMAKLVPDAASYAPVTLLVDARADGVHISYDSMASLIAPYGSRQASSVAEALDAKVEQLLRAAT